MPADDQNPESHRVDSAEELLRLLDEYTVKLRQRADEYDRHRSLVFQRFVAITGLVILLSGAICTMILGLKEVYFVATLTVGFVLPTLVGSFRDVLVQQSIGRGALSSQEELQSLAFRLQKLVRMASQYREHARIGEVTAVRFELKLAEAESALLAVRKWIPRRMRDSLPPRTSHTAEPGHLVEAPKDRPSKDRPSSSVSKDKPSSSVS